MSESTSKQSALSRVTQSRLSRSLLLAFLIMALTEAVFLAGLSFEVMTADNTASSEFALLRTAKDMSTLIKTSTRLWAVMDGRIKHPTDSSGKLNFERHIAQSQAELDVVRDGLEKAKIDASSVVQAKENYAKLLVSVDQLCQQNLAPYSLEQSYQQLLDPSIDAFRNLLKTGQEALEILKSKVLKPPDTEKAKQLLSVAIVVNVIALTVLAFLANFGIVSPIRRLAKACEKLAVAQLMNKPKRIGNEIGSLEQSFFELSAIIHENERRRASTLGLFKDMQKATLERTSAFFQQLISHYPDSPTGTARFRSALKALEALKELMESMTQALQLGGSAGVDVHKHICTVKTFLDTALTSTEPLYLQRNITLEVTAKGEWPVKTDPEAAASKWSGNATESPANTQVLAPDQLTFDMDVDEHLITRVVTNFLSNAIKYSPEGGKIELSVEKQSDRIRFAVQDQGPGIPEGDLGKLFKKFSQLVAVDGIKRKGTGLGLTICKDIVEAHGGQVGVSSVVGQGSCFWFELPTAGPLKPIQGTQAPVAQQAKKERVKSGLQKTFLLMLLIFLVPQVIVVSILQSKFQETASKAGEFQIRKEMFFLADDLNIKYQTWRQDVTIAIAKQEFGIAQQALQTYKDIMKQSKALYRNPNLEGRTKTQLKYALLDELKLYHALFEAMAHMNEITSTASPEFQGPKMIADRIQEYMFGIFDGESEKIENTYKATSNTTTQILLLVGITAILDAAILIAVSLTSLGITDKILTLKKKAEEFADGREISQTIKGNDELTYLDEKLVEASKAIAEAQAEKQSFISVINHDLRTPLNSVLGVLELTNDGVYCDLSKDDEVLAIATQKEVSALLAKVNDLLTLEKIEAGAYQMATEKVSLNQALLQAAEAQSTVTRKKFMRRNFKPEKEIIVTCDRTLIESMLSCIVTNAVTASPQFSTLDLALNTDSKGIEIVVSDAGPGVTPELLPHIFERFRFVDGKPLTGLGLPLAYRIAKLLGGDILIKPGVEKGTVVTVSLPLSLVSSEKEIEKTAS